MPIFQQVKVICRIQGNDQTNWYGISNNHNKFDCYRPQFLWQSDSHMLIRLDHTVPPPVSRSSPDISSVSCRASSSCSRHHSKWSAPSSSLSISSTGKLFPLKTSRNTFASDYNSPDLFNSCTVNPGCLSKNYEFSKHCCYNCMKNMCSYFLSRSGWFVMYSTPVVASSQPRSCGL